MTYWGEDGLETCGHCLHAGRMNPAIHSPEKRRCAVMIGMVVMVYHRACPKFKRVAMRRLAEAKRAGAEQSALWEGK